MANAPKPRYNVIVRDSLGDKAKSKESELVPMTTNPSPKSNQITFPAISFTQSDRKMFLATPTVQDLFNKCKVDAWRPELKRNQLTPQEFLCQQGYQRNPTRSRASKAARYITGPNAIFPCTILLSSREAIRFEPYAQGEPNGVLTFLSGQSLYIVDGQHRFDGLRHAIQEMEDETLLDFRLPVTIMESSSKVDEIKQFIQINKHQQKVKTDLANRLIHMLKEANEISIAEEGLDQKDWQTRAVTLAEKLNADQKSVWYGRIVKPNASRSEFAIAGEGEFTKSLRKVLDADIGGKSFQSDEKMIEVINNYWNAIKSFVPEAFITPADHVIQKTPGFYTWHLALPTVLAECSLEYGRKFSENNLRSILNRANEGGEYLSLEYWESGGDAAAHNSMGSFAKLAKEITECIQSE